MNLEHQFSMADLKYLLVVTIAIFAVELMTKQLRGARLRDYLVTAACISVNAPLMRPLAAIVIAFVVGALLPQQSGALGDTPLWIAFPAVFAAAEFAFYWVHRWSHEGINRDGWNWLWKIHRTHHSAAHLDVSVTMRQNIFWSFVVPMPWVTGVATFLGLGEAAALSILTTYGWNLLTHTHFCWDKPLRDNPTTNRFLRLFQHIIVTPGMHHTHHGYGGRDGKMYRNYAVTLAVYDWLFGTLHLPADRPARYGVPGNTPHWAEEIFFPLVSTEGWSSKLTAPLKRKADSQGL